MIRVDNVYVVVVSLSLVVFLGVWFMFIFYVGFLNWGFINVIIGVVFFSLIGLLVGPVGIFGECMS